MILVKGVSHSPNYGGKASLKSNYNYDIVYLAERRHDVRGWKVSQFIFLPNISILVNCSVL